MPEVSVSAEDRERITRLFERAQKDVVFRGRLAGDPHGCLREYELGHLIAGHPINVALDIGSPHLAGVERREGVEMLFGFHIDANTPHADAEAHEDISTPHADAAPHFDIPEAHADISHEDIPSLHFDI
jgi:hypothetical protein